MEDYNGDVQAESPGPTLQLNGEVLETKQVEELIGCSCEDVKDLREELVEEEDDGEEEEELEEEEGELEEEEELEEEGEEELEEEEGEEEEGEEEEENEKVLVTEKKEEGALVKEEAQEKVEEVVAEKEELHEKNHIDENLTEENHTEKNLTEENPIEENLIEKNLTEENLIEEKPRRKQDSPKLGVRERIEEVKRKTEIEEQKREKELENQRQKAGTNNNMSDKKSRFGGNIEKCTQCNRTVYAMEKLEVAGRIMHKTCFRCCKCNSQLSVGRFSVGGDDLYCMTHYKQAFREKGTYDVFTPNNPCKGKWETKAQQ